MDDLLQWGFTFIVFPPEMKKGFLILLQCKYCWNSTVHELQWYQDNGWMMHLYFIYLKFSLAHNREKFERTERHLLPSLPLSWSPSRFIIPRVFLTVYHSCVVEEGVTERGQIDRGLHRSLYAQTAYITTTWQNVPFFLYTAAPPNQDSL